MATGSYSSTNLTKQQLYFMRLLDENEIDIFTLESIESLLSENFENLNEILENLVHKNLLSRIERGRFCRFNFRDEFVISNYLVPDAVVSYWSALNKHGLTDQFPNTVFVQTSKDKRSKKIFDVQYKFIQILNKKIAGIQIQGYGNHQFRMTDIEKTIVDCFDKPQYSGGYEELISAFGSTKLNSEKMINYCNAIDNIAATKRMGFLAELLNKQGLKAFVSFARQKVNPKYNLFDPFGSEDGVFDNTWKLRLNISKEKLAQICNKIN
jgi:predicted transcriptional regulator of viral defense system